MKKLLKWLKGLSVLTAFCGLLSVGCLLHDQSKHKVEPVKASYYYESVNTETYNFSLFGSVNSINESYYSNLPSYTEDGTVYHWGSLGDYYLKISSSYIEQQLAIDVNFQYKIRNVFYVHNDDSILETNDVYSFNGDYVNVGSYRVAVGKLINTISIRQYYLNVYDSSGQNRYIELGFKLYFNFKDNTNAVIDFDYLTYNLQVNEGYEYEDTNLYTMETLNIAQTFDIINSSNQTSTESAYNEGYDSGYNNGYDDGRESVEDDLTDSYNNGYSAGYNAGYNADSVVSTIFSGIIQVALVPVNFFLGVFNFEILGINLRAFIQALFTIALVIIVVKMVVGGKGGDSSD